MIDKNRGIRSMRMVTTNSDSSLDIKAIRLEVIIPRDPSDRDNPIDSPNFFLSSSLTLL